MRGRWAWAASAAMVLSTAAPAGAESTRDAAKAAYDRGAAAYDTGDYAKAASEFARADAILPSEVALDLALKAAIKADDAALTMAMVERAAARTPSASLASAAEAARTKMEPRTGRLTVRCHPSAPCTGELDGAACEIEKPLWVAAGEHRVVVISGGERQASAVRVDPRAAVVVEARPATLAPSTPAPDPTPAARGASPAWFWAGAGLTGALGVGATVSALDTRSKHDDFALARTADAAREGESAQLRTNVLFACAAASAVVTAIVGVFVVDWGSGSARKAAAGER